LEVSRRTEAGRDPSQVTRSQDAFRTAHEEELETALRRDAGRHKCELGRGAVHELQSAEVKHNRPRSALECRHQSRVKVVSYREIKLSMGL
jgi:hypothetical protein